MKGTIRLIPATEISEGKPVIYTGLAGAVFQNKDSVSCDIKIAGNIHSAYISDSKVLVIEYFTKPMPESRSFKRGYSVTKYNHDMAIYEASRKTILLNPNKWVEVLYRGGINRRIDFTESDNVANIDNFDMIKK